ncbi:MAG: hypothetical protein ACI4PE_02995 [Bacilli bacterium]
MAETKESDFERHIIGPTCTLAFEDEDSIIIGLYFAGIHFEEATIEEQSRDLLPDYRYIETGIKTSNLNEIINPIKNGVYILTDTNSVLEEDVSILTIDKIQQSQNDVYSQLILQSYDENFASMLSDNLTENKYI